MTAPTTQNRDALLVGSVPLANAEEVFQAASDTLGPRLKRIPDGETGARSGWIGWQVGVFAQHPQLEVVPNNQSDYDGVPQFRLRASVDPQRLAFPNLGYADAAIDSYAIFARMKASGAIGPDVRFQVSLPTPLAPINRFIAPGSQGAVEPAYEARLLAEVGELCAAIPHEQLAIQWDIAIEMAIWEGVWKAHFDDPKAGVIARIVRVTAAIPDDIELGYHLCYGDAGHQHFVQPKDSANLVAVANTLSERITRPITWIHMPVPRDRTDEAYFTPLRDLTLHPETELYLGLVHLTDGAEGTKQRIATAERVVPTFGIATECGFGRRPPETVRELLAVHATALAP